MREQSRARLACYALTLSMLGLGPALALAQQVTVESPAALRLRVTTASEEAGRHFWAGVADARNIFFSRAATHFDRAMELDSTLGLARVVRAAFVPGLTTAERQAQIGRGLATMASASSGELLAALAFREAVAGNQQQAHALFETASGMLPGDPNLAFFSAFYAAPAQAVEANRATIEKFPDDAPSYNILAYLLWQNGDHDGAFTAVRRYLALAPDQPNAHDSYAELLQWDGRSNEALAHYGRAIALDSSFVEAYMGSAEVLQLIGRGPDARQQIRQAIARAPAPAARVAYTRALAHSFLMDGMLKDAMDQLAIAARDAQAIDRKPFAAQTHWEMAVVDALLGRGTEIATHLASAAQLGSADSTQQLMATAVAHGTGGDIAAARQAAEKLATAAQSDSQYVTASRTANAVILLRENKPKEALDQLSGAKADDPWVRALLAECYRASGNTVDARGMRSQVIDNPQLNLLDGYAVTARVRAARLKG